MTSITKPPVRHPALQTNALGLTKRDYEGAMSTLCAGCGHDSVTAALVQACFELDLPTHMAAKLSGIGCSAKTTAYFLKQSHGLNGVHGRMPSLASGAHAANRELLCIGVSGDGDSLSIGLGQLCHVIRRNVRMLYVIENNGVYGLTKGQFSASADVGSTSKRGQTNTQQPIDPVLLALTLGATFVARGFSGDKSQLVPILKAGMLHDGFAFVDVISPCVSFNDHEGSTKSYRFTREHAHDVAPIDLVPVRREQHTPHATNGDGSPPLSAAPATVVTMPDGSVVRFRPVDERHDPTDRGAAYAHVRSLRERGEVATGLIYVDPGLPSMHATNGTVAEPLVRLPYESLCPGSAALGELMDELR